MEPLPAEERRKTAVTTPSRFPPEAVKDMSSALIGLLADTFALFFKTKNFHWHLKPVSGSTSGDPLVSPPGGRRLSCDATEDSAEVGLVGKAALQCDFGDGCLGGGHHVLGTIDALAADIVVR
jgi:hypothetical protein